MEGAIFLFLMMSVAIALISGYAEEAAQSPEGTKQQSCG